MQNKIEDALVKAVGIVLLELRLKHRYTQKLLSEPLDITYQQYQKYEKGLAKIPLDKLYILAKFYNVDINYFFKDFDVKIKSKSKDKDTLSYAELNLLRRYNKLELSHKKIINTLLNSLIKDLAA